MLESIASVLSSAGVVSAILSIFWIWRTSGSVTTAHGFCSIATSIFSFTQWYFHTSVGSSEPVHELLTALFIIFAVGMNVFYTHYLQLKVNVNRRRKQVEIPHPDRRNNICR